MVGSIDIKSLNMEELLGVISIYPWYAGARAELCSRMAAAGTLSEQQLSQAALYVGSRRILADLLRSGSKPDYSDSSAIYAAKEKAAPKEEAPQEPARRIVVVGGDYFSATQYKEVRRSDDNVFSGFTNSERTDLPGELPEESFDFCTETLAQIYAEQGYTEEARKIYSKLSLRYPEKSVYFASLIEKIDKN